MNYCEISLADKQNLSKEPWEFYKIKVNMWPYPQETPFLGMIDGKEGLSCGLSTIFLFFSSQ